MQNSFVAMQVVEHDFEFLPGVRRRLQVRFAGRWQQRLGDLATLMGPNTGQEQEECGNG